MNNQNSQHLLEQISVISNKYKDIAKITGENFNIFQILNMSTSEVSLHSKLIAELLNPYGTHDQGTLFLKLFIDECGLTDFLDDVNLNETNVKIEVSIGKISENYESGGRVDIVLNFDTGKSVLIENKIFANDQRKQLLRYHKAYPNSKVVYLNLWGSNEVTDLIGGLSKSEFIWISYRVNIINWLTKSIKEVYNKPSVLYILEHYLNTVKTITNQNTNSNMNKELINTILTSSNNISAAFEISNVIQEIKKNTAETLINQIQNEVFDNLLQKGYNLDLIKDRATGRRNEWAGFKINIDNLPFNLFIYFIEDYNTIFIGLKAQSDELQKNESINNGIKELIQLNTPVNTRKWLYAWMQKEEFIYHQLDESSILEIHNGISITRLTDLFNSILSSVKS